MRLAMNGCGTIQPVLLCVTPHDSYASGADEGCALTIAVLHGRYHE